MTASKTFDFTVNEVNNAVKVKRELAAEASAVWDAFTKAEILDQWWAPKPWVSKTKSMTFKVGGRRLYAMCGPEGEEHWAMADFSSISPVTNFQFRDAFCDPEGNVSDEIARSEWNIDFTDQGESTLVTISIQHASSSDLQTILDMGFKEGFKLALEGLDQVLKQQKDTHAPA